MPAMTTRRYFRVATLRVAALITGAAVLAPASAGAAAQVSGTQQAVRIEAQNTTIEQVLAALSQDFGLQYTSSANLDREISGTYQGPLQRVLARLLEGYNFIVRTSDGRLQVSVLGTQTGNGTTVTASVRPAVVAPTAVSQAASAPQPKPSTPPAPAPAKAAEQAKSGSPAPMPVPSGSGAVPEIKVAEGPVPVPTMTPSSAAPPLPTATDGPLPEVRPSTAVPPLPPASPASLDVPQAPSAPAAPGAPSDGGNPIKAPATP